MLVPNQETIFELFWENYSWDGQLGFAAMYRLIFIVIYRPKRHSGSLKTIGTQ
jgi:hypothetical protein